MTIALSGREASTSQLVIAENWYPDWHAEVDGRPAVVRRVNHTLLAVDLPAGAGSVRLWFASAAYARGKVVSALAVLTAIGMMVLPMVRARRQITPLNQPLG